MKVKEVSTIPKGGPNPDRINIVLTNEYSEETTKNEADILQELKSYYLKINAQMIKMRCANGSDDCAPKEEKDLVDEDTKTASTDMTTIGEK